MAECARGDLPRFVWMMTPVPFMTFLRQAAGIVAVRLFVSSMMSFDRHYVVRPAFLYGGPQARSAHPASGLSHTLRGRRASARQRASLRISSTFGIVRSRLFIARSASLKY